MFTSMVEMKIKTDQAKYRGYVHQYGRGEDQDQAKYTGYVKSLELSR